MPVRGSPVRKQSLTAGLTFMKDGVSVLIFPLTHAAKDTNASIQADGIANRQRVHLIVIATQKKYVLKENA